MAVMSSVRRRDPQAIDPKAPKGITGTFVKPLLEDTGINNRGLRGWEDEFGLMKGLDFEIASDSQAAGSGSTMGKRSIPREYATCSFSFVPRLALISADNAAQRPSRGSFLRYSGPPGDGSPGGARARSVARGGKLRRIPSPQAPTRGRGIGGGDVR